MPLHAFIDFLSWSPGAMVRPGMRRFQRGKTEGPGPVCVAGAGSEGAPVLSTCVFTKKAAAKCSPRNGGCSFSVSYLFKILNHLNRSGDPLVFSAALWPIAC